MKRDGRQALLVLDMISEYRFEDWQPVLRAARKVAPAIARLAQRARTVGVPVIYVNDMAGRWESDQQSFVGRCSAQRARGAEVTRLVAPQAGDSFIFKPKHSGFYATPLAQLLQTSGVQELILTGTTAHQCVLFTAMDAYVRDHVLVAPTDCLAAPTTQQTRHALFILREALRARTPLSRSVQLRQGTRGFGRV